MRKAMALIALVGVLPCALPALAIEKLYFADNGNDKILRCDLDGSNLEELVTTGIEVVGTIAVDRTGGKMYWTDWSGTMAHIQRADLDGANVETMLSGLSGPWGLALDVAGGKLYWTEFSSGRIRRANLDGTGVEDLVTSGLSHAAGIALDVPGGKMYWGDGATEYTGKIMRADLDGANVEILLEDPVIAPQGVALDLAAGKMYWADLGTDSWYRANLDGSGPEEILLSAYGTPTSVALDLAAAKMYVAEYGGSSSEIRRANLDGSGLEILLDSGVGAIYGLTLGPAEAECSDASLVGVWLADITGVEVYDYAVYLIFDGMGTITDMGAYTVPDPAGTYAVEPDCDVTGTIWSDGYVPFTGHVHSETLAEMDIGSGPIPLLKVTDVGALEECWAGCFTQDVTGTVWNVTLEIGAYGQVTSSTGFPGPVTGRIFTESGLLAGHLVIAYGPARPDEIMFLDTETDGATWMSGTYGMDCVGGCNGGTFYLHLCAASAAGDETPAGRPASLRNFPNPFNPRTTIAFTVRDGSPVTLSVFDAAGRRVRTLLRNAVLPPGPATIAWDGRDGRGRPLPSGTYVYRLRAGRRVETGRMTLLR